MPIRLALALLAICGAGTLTGAMLTIGVTLGGFWQGVPPAEFLDWWGANEMLIVRSIAIAAAPTAAGMLGSLLLSLGRPGERLWWGVAVVALLLLAAITAVFHLPINAGFAARTVPLDQVGATIDSWLSAHYVRIALGVIATAAGVIAVAYRRG